MASTGSPPDGLYELLCFHAQQAAEKSLKALLVLHRIQFPYTHNVKILVDLLPPEVTRTPAVLEAARLTDYAFTTRYPGEDEPVSEDDYREAVRLAEAVVEWASAIIGDNSHPR